MADQARKGKTSRWENLHGDEGPRSASWSWADAEMLVDAIVSATGDGAAVLLSRTSDGGALVIQLWDGTQRVKYYPTSSAEINALLKRMVETGDATI